MVILLISNLVRKRLVPMNEAIKKSSCTMSQQCNDLGLEARFVEPLHLRIFKGYGGATGDRVSESGRSR